MADVLPAQNAETTYSFASQPKAIPHRRIYRPKELSEEQFINGKYGNLMYDRRVIRGNTYALQVLPAQAQMDPIEFQKHVDRRRREISKQRAKDKFLPNSPVPLEGRLHKPIQTELYLEALSDFVEEADVECQTDKFLDRPPSPLFVPAKSGEDVATQIYDGDLFNFDLEVIPILEVLIGKTIEQAVLEVAEEEELARIREQQAAFEELRQADLAEVHRLQERERRLKEEKEKRKEEAIRVADRARELAQKVAAQTFAKAYLANLQSSVFANLSENGYFYDPVEYDVENGFLPWLMSQVEEELELETRARMLLDGMIREAVQERHYDYRQLDLLEEEKSLNMAAGAALMQGTSGATSVTTERKQDMDEELGNIEEKSDEPKTESTNDQLEEKQMEEEVEPDNVEQDEESKEDE